MSDEYEIPYRCIPEIGETIDSYKVLGKLGEGSFGSVFKVSNKKKKIYALKLLNLYAVPHEEQRINIMKRFELEYKTGLIESKFLVHAHDYGKVKGNPYIIMDFCPNGDLRSKISSSIPINYAGKIANNILLGLKALHKDGKVHRDLKPENVLLNKDHIACLTDFGISGHKDMRMTKMRFGRPQEIFGTYAYMPPEQIKPSNKNVTILPTTDIFSFGVTMFEIITGELPYGPLRYETDIGEYILRVSTGKWSDIRSLRNDIPNHWVEILETCLHPDYKNRYQNVDDILLKLGKPDYTPPKHYDSVKNHLAVQVMQGEEHGKIYNLSKILTHDEGIVTIGRKDDGVHNNIDIKEEQSLYISRNHATIEKLSNPKGWFIRDGQFLINERRWKFSTNGTFVNSKEIGIEHFQIRPDDIITIGDTTLKVVVI